MSVAAWAETLLSGCLRRHANDARALMRAKASFEALLPNVTDAEGREAYAHIVAGLAAAIAQLDLPLERERAP